MYTTDYLKTFGDTLALPAESRAPLAADYETLLAAPGAAAEMQAAESLLFGGAEWAAIVPHMDRLHACSGLHRHTVDFLFLMAASERLRADYKAAGLSDALFWDTIADLKYKLIECRDVYGIWGTFVAFWHPWFYTMRRFKLGRLQYEAIPFKNGTPVTLGGYTVQPGDTVYNMHIPSCGPLNREVRFASYKKGV
ncbi:MAG: acyltransferase domain-containing protein [Acutalibacteraceae bacterium]